MVEDWHSFTSLQNDEPSQAEVDAYVEYEFPDDEDFALQLDINTTSKFVYIGYWVSLSATNAYLFITCFTVDEVEAACKKLQLHTDTESDGE